MQESLPVIWKARLYVSRSSRQTRCCQSREGRGRVAHFAQEGTSHSPDVFSTSTYLGKRTATRQRLGAMLSSDYNECRQRSPGCCRTDRDHKMFSSLCKPVPREMLRARRKGSICPSVDLSACDWCDSAAKEDLLQPLNLSWRLSWNNSTRTAYRESPRHSTCFSLRYSISL